MKSRVRLLAALLALLAFSASLAEQVWASTCEPGMAREVSSSASKTSAPTAHGAGHGDMPMPGGPHDGGQAPAPAGHDECPLVTLAGGCTLLSLPAPAAEPAGGAPAPETRVSVRADRAPDLLLPSSLFHPPQR
jgi:hypothetical protein